MGIPLWPDDVERVPLGTGAHAPSALHVPARAPTGAPPVVLVHGFRGLAMEWGPIAHRLDAGHDIWAPELCIDPTAPDAGMRPVHALLDQVRSLAGADSVDVVGSSMGGFVTAS